MAMMHMRGLRAAVIRPLAWSRAPLRRPGLTSSLRAPRMGRIGVLPQTVGARAWQSTTANPDTLSPNNGTATEETIAEEKEKGHFEVKSNEAILFIDNIFPLKLISIIGRRGDSDSELADTMRRFDNSTLGIMDPIRLVKNAIPEELPVKVTEIMPRLKDGGAFVKIRYNADLDPAEIEATLVKKLKEKPLKPWFNPFRGIQARLVRGKPWLEDMLRYPSSILKVEFVPSEPGTAPEELPEEVIYSLFRRYGKIADIKPQPTDSKVIPKYVQLSFPYLRDSVMARNCMHGYVVSEAQGGGKDGTMLRLSYIKRVKAHNIWNWLTSHPRIVFPIIAALLAGLSVLIFDPIRQFFIKMHIQHSLNFTESKLYKWFQTHKQSFSFGKRKEQADGLSSVWNHRSDVIQQLREWMDATNDNFIIVTGPRGSGKVDMVMEKSLQHRKDVLLIDCKPVVEARGEAGIIRRLAASVGYRPVFSWANSLSSMVDLAVQSTTGVKAGFSETLESQLNKILYTTAAALKEVALSTRPKKEKDGMSEDAYLEAHPERRPVIVIDNFLHKADEKGIIYDKIAEWAASVVQNNVAQVVILTSEPSYSKPLIKALPDRAFKVMSLGDLDRHVARKYIVGRLDEAQRDDHKSRADPDKKQHRKPSTFGLEKAIETLGGRLTDLESLARRIQAGQSPEEATDEIVTDSATDTVKMFLLGKTGDEVTKSWSTPQVWQLIKSLAKDPSLRYNQVLLSPNFASSTTASAANGEAALEGLAAAELIAIKTDRGHPKLITAGRPLHQAAFAVLAADRVLGAKMDLAMLSEQSKIETKAIQGAENELALLGSLPRQTSESAGRVNYLLGKVDASQRKIEKLDKEMGLLKKILNEEV